MSHLSAEGQILKNASTTVKMNPIYQEVHPAPDIAGGSLQIVVEATQRNAVADGVLLAHGGNVTGYSLHVEQGIPTSTGVENRSAKTERRSEIQPRHVDPRKFASA